jgi:hypothetical protein
MKAILNAERTGILGINDAQLQFQAWLKGKYKIDMMLTTESR